METSRLVLEYLRVLVWPGLALTAVILFRREVVALLSRLKHAQLPGGITIDLQEEIRQARLLSERVETSPPRKPEAAPAIPPIPRTEANARLTALGLRPSPSGLDMSYYRLLAAQDPALGLAGLRIEVDVLARNLATGFKIKIDSRDTGARLLRALFDAGGITLEQMKLGLQILHLADAAIHGTPVTQDQANAVIDTASVLASQYLSWLSWGFPDDWTPSRPLEPPAA